MYDELVKRLRVSVDGRYEKCDVCPYEEDYPCCVDCLDKMHKEAADAIEELSKRVDESIPKDDAEIIIAEVAKPRWIPVTERLPEDGKFVLVCNDDGHMMIAKHETETYEWYYKYTNYDFDIWDNEEQGPVRYWMPLSEPPKEE